MAIVFSSVFFPAISVASDDLTGLSIEALMDLEVTSVSRKPQRLANAAAAAFVITQEDIRRSGAVTIPDLLRMVPGLQVASIDANKWAVSIRGFNGRFANKLLVLKDGRSVYTPLFSGVYWETQDTPLEDIERIEVIRGPGAALWGANAVNGVINIITRNAADTAGGLVSAGSGSAEKGFGLLRYGFEAGQSSAVKVYASYNNRGARQYYNGSDANDAWQSGSAGFRLDSRLTSRDSLTVQGDFTSGSFDERYTLFRLPDATDAAGSWTENSHSRADGHNLLARWQRTLSETESLSLQLYYDHYYRKMLVLGETRDTFDLDFQHRVSLGSIQDIIWGIGYRYTADSLGNTPYIIFDKTRKGTSLASGFILDEITLLKDRLALILGVRLEHNDYSGFEVQPNARLLWTPSARHSFWVSVSRAVRTPSRGDQDIQYRFRTVPAAETGMSIPMRLEIDGSSDFRSETVISYEIGYRTMPLPEVSFDMALFFNQYDSLRLPASGYVSMETAAGGMPSNLLQRFVLDNNMHGHTYGAELSVSWKPLDWWRLQASYSYLCSIMHIDDTSINGLFGDINRANAASGSPRHQGSIRSGFNIGRNIELDLWLRAVDRVSHIDTVSIPGYLTMDARLAWKPSRRLELALVGQNLFRSSHPEYIPEFINTTASEVPRSVYGKITWKF